MINIYRCYLSLFYFFIFLVIIFNNHHNINWFYEFIIRFIINFLLSWIFIYSKYIINNICKIFLMCISVNINLNSINMTNMSNWGSLIFNTSYIRINTPIMSFNTLHIDFYLYEGIDIFNRDIRNYIGFIETFLEGYWTI